MPTTTTQPPRRRFDNFAERVYGATAAIGRAVSARASAPPPPPKPPAAPKVSAEEVARRNRVARHDAVMGSPHARQRQRTAKALLNAPENWTAEQIVAALPTMLTDAQLDAKVKQDAADAVWSKARAEREAKAARILAAQRGGSVKPKSEAAERILAAQTKAGGGPSQASLDVWERAYANAAGGAR